jgi:hypothetical protein
MRLFPEEPSFGPWRAQPLTALAQQLQQAAGSAHGRPPIVAIDGRSSSGKTTLARRLQQAVPGSCLVHTDDIAWRQAVFDWAYLLTDGVLRPLRDGHPTAFRPPAWDRHSRPGAIEVPRDASLVIVEGVGAGRREAAHLVDAIVWVQADADHIDQRNADRVAAGEVDPVNLAGWMAQELPFLADQRPWERATIVVAGSPVLPHAPSEALVSDRPPPHPSTST